MGSQISRVSFLSAFADYVHRQRDVIDHQWMQLVRDSQDVPGALHISPEALRDHVPRLIDDLVGRLRLEQQGSEEVGMTGMTAWAGLKLVEVKAGDVLFVSGAAGAVGNVAGQLAKLRGCHVIGSAGSAGKVKFLREECGFDAAFNYKAGPVLEQLHREAPDGIDVYFDNVGGEALEAALSALRVHGRIIACGGISGYNEEKPQPGPSNLFNMTTKRLTMKGLIVTDWLDRQRPGRSDLIAAGTYWLRPTRTNG